MYLVTDRQQTGRRDLVELVGHALAAGADGVALISAVLAASDPAAATRRVLEAIAGNRRAA